MHVNTGYCRRLGSLLLYLCYRFQTLINSLVCSFCTSALGLVLIQICTSVLLHAKRFLKHRKVFRQNHRQMITHFLVLFSNFLGSVCKTWCRTCSPCKRRTSLCLSNSNNKSSALSPAAATPAESAAAAPLARQQPSLSTVLWLAREWSALSRWA